MNPAAAAEGLERAREIEINKRRRWNAALEWQTMNSSIHLEVHLEKRPHFVYPAQYTIPGAKSKQFKGGGDRTIWFSGLNLLFPNAGL